MKKALLVVLNTLLVTWAMAQTATITGTIRDKKDNSELIGVTVLIKGTSLGAATDMNGQFTIKNIKPGEYTVEVSYVGYNKTLLTGIKVKAGEVKDLQVELIPTSVTTEDVVIVGKKPLIDIDKAQTVNTISQENIELAPARQLQSIVNTQPGVIQSPAGVSIRGGRTYETGVYVDGVKVTDPLGGTGFGLDIGSNAISDIEVTTGGIGAEVGDATAGVINTKTRSGGEKLEVGASYKRDNFGFNKDYQSSWNSQVGELNVSGPLLGKTLDNRLRFSVALRAAFTDEYYKNPANQLYSSLYSGSDGKGTFWTPYQDNRWSAFVKMNYNFKGGKVLTVSQLRSISINQDVNMLRIFGNDLPFQPGYQYNFQEQMDNANTFTHDAYMTAVNWKQSVSKRFSYDATFSRFFVRLRSDANGRDWRPDQVDQELNPASIILYPAQYFNPGDSVAYVAPSSGFFNNNGIATLWHDHYFEEYTAKIQGNLTSANSLNRLSFGMELKFQEMQWIDIIRPWIGAPIPLANGGQSQTFRLGQQSDVWKVNPQRGGFFVTDQIKYKGLVANIGGRFEYWAPGAYVDNAVADPRAPIRDEIRQSYLDNSTKIGNLRYKFRFLPKISASFPIRENQVLYFNYGHTTILPHPSFIYPGLNPFYQDRSTIANVGNPDLNPEVDISYEIGLKTQITSNDALTLAAFWKDKYDFITTTTILIPDATGREVNRTIRINSDYARTRGIELGYIKRIGNWYNGQASFTYMVTTGQSASANEAVKEILASGANEDTREFYLPWDVPIDFKTNHLFKVNTKTGLFGVKWLNNMSFYVETVLRSGVRYTPFVYAYDDPNTGRPIYLQSTDPNDRWSEVGEYWFWTDFTFTKSWKIKKAKLSWNIQITNIFNNENASIINPVTGRAYSMGDNVPDGWVDPRFRDPRVGGSGPPPTNPARFLAQRHIMTGIAVKF
ncbi:MAG: TonB-dependent receptor [Bacteroidia bacterium]|jgi:outer membrane receptor protein involved in Fe transport|nr:TonB-dependent receptor [Bacteroidia bacterium]